MLAIDFLRRVAHTEFDPAGTGSSSSAEDARTVSDGGLVPVGKKIWLVAGRNPCKIGTAMAE